MDIEKSKKITTYAREFFESIGINLEIIEFEGDKIGRALYNLDDYTIPSMLWRKIFKDLNVEKEKITSEEKWYIRHNV